MANVNNTSTQPDALFQNLWNVIHTQQQLILSISEKLQRIESIGSGGNASIGDYEANTEYVRNTLLVDPMTETMYRVIADYTSISVETDCVNGNLKLVGFESQIVTYDHEPTQNEINTIPDDTLVAIYSKSDAPYDPANME